MEKAMTEREIEAVLREVTDEEVAFYREYGWVMMKQLVAPEFATELLRVGKEWRQRREKEGGPGKPSVGLALDEAADIATKAHQSCPRTHSTSDSTASARPQTCAPGAG